MCMMITDVSPSRGIVSQRRMIPDAADEANHRIANQLQLVAALIAVEARGASRETIAALERTRERIVAIGAVHRHLHTSDDGAIDLGDYLEELGERLSRSCGPGRPVTVDAETVPVTSATATMVGVLATELVTNACKHAYRAGEPGGILMTLHRRADGRYRFAVEDRGRASATPSAGTGLGNRLIHATAAKLGATVAWEDAAPGTRFLMDVRFRPDEE